MLRLIPMLFAAALLMVPALDARAQSEISRPLVIGVEAARPPFVLRGPSGALMGFEVDVARWLGDALQRRVALRIVSPEDAGLLLYGGEIDLLIAGPGRLEEQRALLRELRPVLAVDDWILWPQTGEDRRLCVVGDALAPLTRGRPVILSSAPATALDLSRRGFCGSALMRLSDWVADPGDPLPPGARRVISGMAAYGALVVSPRQPDFADRLTEILRTGVEDLARIRRRWRLDLPPSVTQIPE